MPMVQFIYFYMYVYVVIYIISIHLYSACHSACQSAALPVQVTQREESSLETAKIDTWLTG